jgi:hypothetical protein
MAVFLLGWAIVVEAIIVGCLRLLVIASFVGVCLLWRIPLVLF